jgi:hypothetical protein
MQVIQPLQKVTIYDIIVLNTYYTAKKEEKVMEERAKSEEELRFEKLMEEGRTMSMEGHYMGLETPELEQLIHETSMRGAWWESDDPEKKAMFVLWNMKMQLNLLALCLEMLEHWEESQKRKSMREKIKASINGWVKGRGEYLDLLKPVLLNLGLPVPQTAEEAKELERSIVNFENFLKITNDYKNAMRSQAHLNSLLH